MKSHVSTTVEDPRDRIELQLISEFIVYLNNHIFLQFTSLSQSLIRSHYEEAPTKVFHTLLELCHKSSLENTITFKKSKLLVTWNFIANLIINKGEKQASKLKSDISPISLHKIVVVETRIPGI